MRGGLAALAEPRRSPVPLVRVGRGRRHPHPGVVDEHVQTMPRLLWAANHRGYALLTGHVHDLWPRGPTSRATLSAASESMSATRTCAPSAVAGCGPSCALIHLDLRADVECSKLREPRTWTIERPDMAHSKSSSLRTVWSALISHSAGGNGDLPGLEPALRRRVSYETFQGPP